MAEKLAVRHPALGRRIKAAIAEKGTDIRSVSGALNMSYESVRRYVGGISKPRPEALDALAAHLGVTRGYLLDDQDATALTPASVGRTEVATPTKEQLEGLKALLTQRHPNGFSATVMQRLPVGVWLERMVTSRAVDAPQYFLLLGASSLDDLVDLIN